MTVYRCKILGEYATNLVKTLYEFMYRSVHLSLKIAFGDRGDFEFRH